MEIDKGKIKALVKDLVTDLLNEEHEESHRVRGTGILTEDYCLKQLTNIEILLDGFDVDIWWLNKHSEVISYD